MPGFHARQTQARIARVAPADPYIAKGARLSADGVYRYRLWREWRGTPNAKWRWMQPSGAWSDNEATAVTDGAGAPFGEPKICAFVMLNPSTADGETDDPTIRRCVNYCKAWGYERLEVVNLFAYRATDPAVILKMDAGTDPVGYENQEIVEEVARDADLIVCAWGAHGSHLGQADTLLGWTEHVAAKRRALGLTQDGQPRHPLYLKADSLPFPWGAF